MQPNESPLNLPALELVINRHPLTVKLDTPLVDVLSLMGQVCLRNAGETVLEDRGEQAATEKLPLHSDCVLVTDGLQLVDAFTPADVVQLTASGRASLSQLTIAEVMRQPIITLTRSDAQDIFTTLLTLFHHSGQSKIRKKQLKRRQHL